MNQPVPEIVVAGHLCLDMIPTFEHTGLGLSDLLVPGKLIDVGPLTAATGGPVSNTGLALHRLGYPVSLMGKVGDDMVGRAILDIVRGYGPTLAGGMIVTTESHSSYTVVISPPGVDRIFFHSPGANDTFGADDVAYEKLAGARLFHFGYPPLMRRMYEQDGAELATLLQRVKQRGLTTSLDMARPDPRSEAGRADWRAILANALPSVDVFLPSFDETLYMLERAHFDDLEQAAPGGDLNAHATGELLKSLTDELIGLGAAVVGLKLGRHGMYLHTTADLARLKAMGACAPPKARAWVNRELLSPCFAAEVVGTTGSGDCTIAGFLGSLLKGESPEHAMTAAVAVGACNVEAPDAIGGVPPWAEVAQRVAAGWARRETGVALDGWTYDHASGLWHGPKDKQ